jgi:hypothetical protein
MLYDDFTAGAFPGARWMRFRHPTHDLWDPATRADCAGGTLTLSLPRFTQSHPNHVKALMLSTEEFDLERGAGFVVRVEMAVRIFGTEANPHRLEPGDVRLAAGALVTIDPATGNVFDFFVSNDRIRPLYERLPVARPVVGPYACYSILGESMPSAPGAWHRYEIRYDRAGDRVDWLVDGRAVAMQSRAGASAGSALPGVKSRRLRVGGGLFTLLDDLCDDRETADDHPRISGCVPSNLEDRFGQGGEVSFRRFEVEI